MFLFERWSIFYYFSNLVLDFGNSSKIGTPEICCLFRLITHTKAFWGGGAVLALRCCAWAFSSCGERGLLFAAVRGLLIAVASLSAEPGL